MTPIGKSGSSSAQQVQDIQRRTSEHELDQITPKVTASRQGAVSHQQMPGGFPQASSAKFAPSSKLLADAKRLATGKQKMSADQLSQRMKFEGRLIAERMEHAERTGNASDANISFVDIAGELGLEDALPKELDTLNADCKARLDNILAADSPEHDKVQGMAKALKDLLGAQADLFSAHAAHYEEVRRLPETSLSTEDRADILRSELSFAAYATHAACVVPDMVTAAHNKAQEVANQLEKKGNTEEAKPWQATAQQLKAVQKEILPDFKVAVDQAKLSKVVHDYQQVSDSTSNKLKAFTNMGLRQGIAVSGVALGATRAFTLAGLSDSPVGQLLGAAATTAIAHEVSTHLLAPALMELIGGATVPVSTLDVLPAPNKFVSEQGQVRPRSAAELKAAEDELKPLRAAHAMSINANKVGSGTGDSKGWTPFAISQGARGAIVSTKDYDKFQEAGAVTVGSIAAGFFMGGIHAADGLNAKMEDQFGRKLPAYTLKTSEKPIGERLSKVGKTAVENLNPFVEKNFTTYANKTAGLATGMALGKLGEPILDAVADSSTATKAGVSALVSGAQSVVLLSQAWGAFSLSPQVAADRKALTAARAKTALEEGKEPAEVKPGMLDRTRTTYKNMVDPDRSDGSHAFEKGTLGRVAENTYLRTQGAGGLVGALTNDLVAAGGKAAIGKITGAGKKPDKSAAAQTSTSTPAAAGSSGPTVAQPDPLAAAQPRKPVAGKPDKPAVASGSGADSQGGQGKK